MRTLQVRHKAINYFLDQVTMTSILRRPPVNVCRAGPPASFDGPALHARWHRKGCKGRCKAVDIAPIPGKVRRRRPQAEVRGHIPKRAMRGGGVGGFNAPRTSFRPQKWRDALPSGIRTGSRTCGSAHDAEERWLPQPAPGGDRALAWCRTDAAGAGRSKSPMTRTSRAPRTATFSRARASCLSWT